MADYHLGRDGEELGVFPEDEIRDGLPTGRFLPSDLAWTEGMSDWRRVDQMEIFVPPQPATASPEMAAPALEAGPPFELRGKLGFLPSLFTTVSLVLTRPRNTFTSMRHSGGFTSPVLFLLVLSWSVQIFTILVFDVPNGELWGGDSSTYPGFETLVGRTGLGSLGLMLVFAVVLPPIVVAAQFIGAAITHFCLHLVGGANRPFETTFRVACYTSGSASVFNLLPVLGPFLVLFWGGVVQVIGLAAAHATGIGRVIAALLLPLITALVVIAAIAYGLWG